MFVSKINARSKNSLICYAMSIQQIYYLSLIINDRVIMKMIARNK